MPAPISAMRIAATALLLSDHSLPHLSAAGSTAQQASPVIGQARLSGRPAQFQFSIQDAAGAMSYDILTSSSPSGPFAVAEQNVPVSGTGVTTWSDGGRFVDATKARFFKIRVNALPPELLAERSTLYPPQHSFFNFSSGPREYSLHNTGDTDLSWKIQTSTPWLSISPSSGVLPSLKNTPPRTPYSLVHSWTYPNENWEFTSPSGIGVRSDNKVFVLDYDLKLIKVFDLKGQLLHGLSFGSLDESSHIAFDHAQNIFDRSCSDLFGSFSF